MTAVLSGTSALGALRVLDVAAWRTRVRGALAEARGYVRDRDGQKGAATILGVSRDTLFRWLREDPVLSRIPRRGPGAPGTEEKRGRGKKEQAPKKKTCA